MSAEAFAMPIHPAEGACVALTSASAQIGLLRDSAREARRRRDGWDVLDAELDAVGADVPDEVALHLNYARAHILLTRSSWPLGGAMFPGRIVVGVVRFLWAPGPEVKDQRPHLMWPEQFYQACFQGSNGWSLRDYWLRGTFGLLDLQFDFGDAGWWRLEQDQATLKDDRGKIVEACRRAAEDGGRSLAGYDDVVAFVHAPPCDAGALGEFGDVVFDQGAGEFEYFQHEIGHLLGFQHAWGAAGVYEDQYCVMGYTGPFSHRIPPAPEAAGATILSPTFWSSGRRVSGASLYRLFSSPRMRGRGIDAGVGSAGFFDPHVVHGQLGQSFTVTALSEARGNEPVLAVVPVPEGGVLTVEYRTSTGDDQGVTPAVVVHTVGARSIGSGHHEVDPPWFEVAIPPHQGASAPVLQKVDLAGRPFGGYTISVTAVRTGPGPVQVDVSVR